jgi:hypothetical protein
MLHLLGAPGAPQLAVDPDLHAEGVQDGQDLRCRDHDRAERGAEVLGLGRPHETLDHLAELHVAGAEVVQQHEAARHAERLLAGQVRCVPDDDDPDLQLVVESLGVGRPPDGVTIADERRRVALVVQRPLVPQRARTQPRERSPGQPLVAVGHAPGNGLTPGGGLAQPQQAAARADHVLLPQRAITERCRTERQAEQVRGRVTGRYLFGGQLPGQLVDLLARREEGQQVGAGRA